MSDAVYWRVAGSEDVPQGKTLCVEVEGREVLVCHTAEGYFAVENQCTHAQARLCEGKLKGHRILCPLHGAAFDIRDGTALTRPASAPLKTYVARVIGDAIEVLFDRG